MNLYTRAAMAITLNCQARIERLNLCLPAFQLAEDLQQALHAAGLDIEAGYDVQTGVILNAEIPADQLQQATETICRTAGAFSRTVVPETPTRFRLVQSNDQGTEQAITLHIEEI